MATAIGAPIHEAIAAEYLFLHSALDRAQNAHVTNPSRAAETDLREAEKRIGEFNQSYYYPEKV